MTNVSVGTDDETFQPRSVTKDDRQGHGRSKEEAQDDRQGRLESEFPG